MSELNLESNQSDSEKTTIDPERAKLKFDLWERKLLDLSTRNSLLNLRIKGSAIPLFVPGCADIENLIAQEKNFQIISRGMDDEEEPQEEVAEEKTEATAEETSGESPAEQTETAPAPVVAEAKATEEPEPVAETPVAENTPLAEASTVAKTDEEPSDEKKKKVKGIPPKDYSIEDIADISGFKEYIDKKYEKGVLVSSITDAVLDKNLKTLYRGAKASMEENGANTLYLACGFLKWYEKDRKDPCYAPLILIPVDLVKKFGIKYTMRRRDEDTQFNITVSEKLRQDFNIEFDEFSKQLPTDENGVDVDKILSGVRTAVSSMKGWTVVESCVLGLFSFSQFVMWNDMHSHRDSVSKNKIVSSLINGCLDKDFKQIEANGRVPEEDVFLPISADSSQLAAIKCSGEGKTFVLHGPPGTGKSQTITSIIANCLANGKKVLFAAEKKAALDVVYNRLEKIGIAPFCLELHSNKVRKSYVLDQLRTASEVKSHLEAGGDYEKALEDIASKRKELDFYVDELHKMHECGMTLYELINVYASNKEAVECGDFDEGFIGELTSDRIKAVETALGELVASSGALNGKLPFVKSSEYSQDAKNRIPVLVDAFVNAYDEFVATLENFEKIVAQNNCRISGDPQTIGRIAGLSSCASAVIRLKDLGLPKGYICCDDAESAYLAVRDAIALSQDAVKLRDSLLAYWQPGFLDCDGAALLNELMTARSRNIFVRGAAENNVYKKVSSYDLKLSRRDQMEQDFKLLADYRNAVQNATNYIVGARGYLGELYNPGAAFPGFDIASVQALNEAAHTALADFGAFDPTGMLRKLIGSGDVSVVEAAEAINGKASAYKSTYDELSSVYGFEYGCFEPSSELLSTKRLQAESLKSDSDYLRDRMQFNLMASRCNEFKISNLVKGYGSGSIAGNELIGSFRKGYSSRLIATLIDSSDVLRTFSGLVFEKKIDELSRLSDEFEKLTRQEIYLRIAKNLPDVCKDANVSSALGILQHAIKSGGRGVSIRTLFTQIGDLILKLCPCVLMSPLSCAQYLDPDKCGMFDIVVFDEASQLPTCKAVGVIARGKEAVIVGDPKQMPPTSFFTEQVAEDEYSDTDDLESILDDCLAISIPQMYLAWHYRSRHESLITFSNKAFYDGRLYTFPSPDDCTSKVTYVTCEGTFDSGKTRTNKTEAQAVIDEIIKRAHDPELSKYSLGVVTFNISQQGLIEDLLDEAASKDPVLEKWAFGGEEPVFIKNLENVQGDERDVILFSVGYGKDETGKLIMNFGPLNRDGGWRRLNVAVTRSRIEMKVFSSLSPEEIRINETASEGVKSFKRFLQYAEGSSVWDQDIVSTGSSSDSEGTPLIDRNAAFTGIADDICSRFKAIGYGAEKNIGKSGFKIDIGVTSPDKPDEYCLGILLDGPVYASSGTTTSREVSQISMLKGFGWNVVRIWSLEWWENPDKVFEKLVDRIKNAQKPEPEVTEQAETVAEVETLQEGENEAESSADSSIGESESDPQISIYDPSVTDEAASSETQKKTTDVADAPSVPGTAYEVAQIKEHPLTSAEFCDVSNTEFLLELVTEIVNKESPVSSNVIAKELITITGQSKMTPKLRERCSYLVKKAANVSGLLFTSQRLDLSSDDDDSEVIFVWKEGTILGKVTDFYRFPAEGTKPRKACDIPVQEAACASYYLAKSQYGMPYASLITETCKALGFTRAPEDSDNYRLGKRAVDYCVCQQLLALDDDGFVKIV